MLYPDNQLNEKYLNYIYALNLKFVDLLIFIYIILKNLFQLFILK